MKIIMRNESNPEKEIAILLTVHNRKDKTLSCLRALKVQKLPEHCKIDVFMTDDGCTDGTPEAVASEFPDVNIIKGDGNLFWNRGMYAAWTEAEKNDFDYYLWLNDDTFLLDMCINNLLRESALYNDNAIIIGATINSAGDRITYSGWRNNKIIDSLTNNREANCFNGNIVLIPQNVFAQLGKNDPYFRHALGDFDYGLRATELGIKNIVCPDICGICDEHATIPKWMNPVLTLKERWKSLYSVGGNGANPVEYFYFRKKHYGLFCACMTFLSNHLHVFFPQYWTRD